MTHVSAPVSASASAGAYKSAATSTSSKAVVVAVAAAMSAFVSAPFFLHLDSQVSYAACVCPRRTSSTKVHNPLAHYINKYALTRTNDSYRYVTRGSGLNCVQDNEGVTPTHTYIHT